ncbi:hypothetical protein K9L16_02120 [Candidatus Pacearchaeota archaeon]|nr:hypothetical protein [Candidatus Pacearchaeota archaeon]
MEKTIEKKLRVLDMVESYKIPKDSRIVRKGKLLILANPNSHLIQPHYINGDNQDYN